MQHQGSNRLSPPAPSWMCQDGEQRSSQHRALGALARSRGWVRCRSSDANASHRERGRWAWAGRGVWGCSPVCSPLAACSLWFQAATTVASPFLEQEQPSLV